MQLRVGQCKSGSGKKMAFATLGRGPALLLDFGWLSHFEEAWQFAPYRAFLERLAGNRTLILHDKPGFGGSAGPSPDLSLEAGAGAIEGLAAHLGLVRFDLLGAIQAGPIAVAYAAANPRRLNRLVLYGTYCHGSLMAGQALQASLLSVIRAHWGIGSQMLADLWMPDGGRAGTEWFARYQRLAASSELAASAIATCYTYDVRPAAAMIRVPTLVLHRSGDRAVPIEAGRELATAIPGAEFRELSGRSHLPFIGDSESVVRAVLAFLGVGATDINRGAPPRLTARELEVASLVARGRTNSEIGRELGIAGRTAEAHVQNIRSKLRLRTRSEVATWSTVNQGRESK